eukprot:1619608-Prorocentrum_lima.AAC.1
MAAPQRARQIAKGLATPTVALATSASQASPARGAISSIPGSIGVTTRNYISWRFPVRIVS